MFPNSLSFRLLSMIAVWTTIALLVTGIILSTIFRQNAEREFARLLEAHTYNLMGAIDVDENGALSGSPNLGDPRFLTPSTGWYWSVATAQQPKTPLLHSPSITAENLPVQDIAEQPFDGQFRRVSEVQMEDGGVVQQLEAQLYLGEGNTLFQVLVAGNKSATERAVSSFNRILSLFFLLFGAGTIIATYFVIKAGLKPLTLAANSLHEVREGHSEYLKGKFPTEIEPLAGEINALIQANKTIVDRARTQVGNLAHALKTPLAVMLNEVRKPSKSTPELISEQAGLMKSQVQTYLNRARVAAQRNTTAARTPVDPVIEKLLRVMRKLSPNIEFEFVSDQSSPIFKGEEQDLEEVLGNLLENASRFARNKVEVGVLVEGSGAKNRSFLTISISDDGAGLPIADRDRALKRGTRLDESQPGSGLGLSIVRDIATEYGGTFELDESSFGGLKAVIFLPRVNAR